LTKATEAEFHTFVAERMDRWRRSAYLMCQDWHAADDLVSLTVTRLYRNWAKVRAADNRDAYAQKVLTRCWLTERRRPWWRHERPADEPVEQAWTPPDTFADRDALAAALRSLGKRQRAVVILRYYLGYSVEDTAAVLRVSTGTVKSQAARGLEILRGTSITAQL
jgi:RNA polymerase sigma-70 factor (sigma-E family)